MGVVNDRWRLKEETNLQNLHNPLKPNELSHTYQLQAFSECVLKIIFLISQPTKTYVVGTQKNRLNEAVLLSTQNICLN